MKALRQLATNIGVLFKARRNRLDLVVMTQVPVLVPDDLRHRLDDRLSPTELAELVAVIAWENQRARLNQGLGICPSGFSDGEYCVLPELRRPA